MNELLIQLDNKECISVNDEIKLEVLSDAKDIIQYKFIEGHEKVWNPIQDFSADNICRWTPKNPGKHMILVQGKLSGSTKPYDFLGRLELDVKDNVKLIKNIICENNRANIGDKVSLTVESDEEILLYRFWIKGTHDWEILRDYTTDNSFIYTANEAGIKEFLIECKRVNSTNNVDDFSRVKVEVKDLSKVEIVNFSSITDRFITNEELVFKVDVNQYSNPSLLYKFYRMSDSGKISCVQDYSSKSSVSFKEKQDGTYKLLCLVRHMFSTNEYDDRAVITYTVKPYEKISIKGFKSDLSSPQAVGTKVNFTSMVSGGRELLYRYIIEGPVPEDSGYSRSSKYQWKPTEEGKYNITLLVKDLSYEGDFQDRYTLIYEVDEKDEKPVRIIEVKCDKGRRSIVGHNINVTAKAEGGSKVLYKFIVYKDGVQYDEVDFGKSNWIDFTPEDIGEYEIEVRAKDFYSMKEYDSTSSIYIQCSDFIPAKIDHLLTNCKDINLVNDTIEIEAVMENTQETLLRFVTKINGHAVEDTDFVENKLLRVKPKCPGKYTFVIYGKNVKSTEEYDTKKELNIYIQDSVPVNSTKVIVSKDEIKVGDEVTFEVSSRGGKDVCYQFYLMKDNNWVLVQDYGKKNYYTFIPFSKGQYRMLVLAKSYYKTVSYEDHTTVNFNIEE